ncbi:ApaG domain, partial [Akkermansiaceae bacterium]|nr:ApaG domain [Akkermansiaceae bacterium]
VEVEEVLYMPHLDAPKDRPYPFVYFVSIINDSQKTVTILGRKWVLHDDNGEVIVLEGGGVVGETPELTPGKRFSYNSYHVIKSESQVTGSFFGKTKDGTKVRVTIPGFSLKLPE